MKYLVKTTSKFKKSHRKLGVKERELVDGVVWRLACGEVLEARLKTTL